MLNENLIEKKGQRLLGIDYGKRFIGLAVSDIMWQISTPLPALDVKSCNAFQTITSIVSQHAIGGIVIGYPKHMNNSEGLECEEVRDFADKLKKFVPNLPVMFWDERLTTVSAEKNLISAGFSREKRKKKIDSIAASYILDTALTFLGQA